MGNLRRWATAVLFAWVLLMPPVLIDGTVNQKAPLSQWQVLLRFSSGAACEASRTQAEGPYDPFIAKGSAGSHAFDNELKCVSESDPRLKP